MVPYLTMWNTEIANAARTLSYLRRFASSRAWAAQDACSNCWAIGGSFYSPVSDPAPWYSTAHPTSSAAFLGLVLDSIVAQPVLSRSVKQLANGGSAIGRQIVKGRTVQASGAMFATSDAGMEYGSRWLAKALQGPCDDPCGLSSLCLLPACPDLNVTPRWRHLYGAGLIDGPTIAVVPQNDATLVRTVAFQIGTQVGYLFSDPTTVLSGSLAANVSQCGTITTTQWYGDATSRITVVAGGPNYVTNLQISAAPLRSNESCPSPSPSIVSFTVPLLRPGSTLVIDGTTRTVQVSETNSGDITAGLDVVNTGGGPLDWIDIGPCATVCVCLKAATVNAGTTVLVEKIDREL